ncbi:MAG: hypothetical protein C3F13_17185 [Anaerolineales bacterium]|nr:MAG: hypothetical protein C3F13_17185 [Anaerolineales bacterium]
MYNGPGNINFDSVASLNKGDNLSPIGIYGDFVKAEAYLGGIRYTGYINKNTIGFLPSNLPELTTSNVPWEPIFFPYCTGGAYDPASDTLTFVNQRDSYYDTETKAIKLDAPLRIKLDKLSVTGSTYNIVKILGVPETQEPWWKGIRRLDILNNGDHYLIGVRDGTAGSYNIVWDLQLSSSQPFYIIFDQVEGKSFNIYNQDGNVIQHIDLTQQPQLNLPDGLFPQGVVYIGSSTAPNSTSFVTGLSVGVIPNGKWVSSAVSDPGLAELAKSHNLTIGTAFSMWENADNRHCRVMKREYGVAAIYTFSLKGFWLGPGKYDFSELDREVDYANQMGWRVRAMHLVWGAVQSDVIPEWLIHGDYGRNQYIKILEQHVKTLVGRYKGRVHEWSIANEAPGRSFSTGADFWNDKIGPDYIDMAFRWARETDPEAILIFNQDNNESPRDPDSSRVIDKMYSTLQQLKANGTPIDVVGMQMHLFLPWYSKIAPEKDDVIATMQKFANLGVRIYVTEMDVDLTDQPGTQLEKWNYQAQIYRSMMEACIESQVCDSFSTWGISDATSWITCERQGCVKEPNADPLLFDRDFNPKPAYFALRDVLSDSSFLIVR